MLTPMNRRDSAAQTAQEPAPHTHFNLSRVRPGLSSVPQTIRADFKVRSSAQELEIQFSQHRLRENLFPILSEDSLDESTIFGFWAVLSTVVLVGGAVALTNSIWFGVVVAAILPIFFGLAAFPKKAPEAKCNRVVNLKLSSTPHGHTLLGLTTAPPPPKKGETQQSTGIPKSTRHFSKMPLRAVKLAPTRWHSLVQGESLSVCFSPLSCHVSFMLYEHRSRRINRLRIAGSRQDIQWLYHHLSQWGYVSIEGRCLALR